MNVSLTPQLELLIRQKIDAGYYNNASEVIRDALRLLETRDREQAWLGDRMADSAEQFRRGDVIELDDDFWDTLNREIDNRIARGHVPNPDVCP